MADDNGTINPETKEQYIQLNDLDINSSYSNKPKLDVWYVRKVGIITLLISYLAIPPFVFVSLYLIVKVYDAAGGVVDVWGSFDGYDSSKSPAVWFYPIFILITLANIYLGYRIVKLTRKMIIKIYPPVFEKN